MTGTYQQADRTAEREEYRASTAAALTDWPGMSTTQLLARSSESLDSIKGRAI